MLAESHLIRLPFGSMVRRIDTLAVATWWREGDDISGISQTDARVVGRCLGNLLKSSSFSVLSFPSRAVLELCPAKRCGHEKKLPKTAIWRTIAGL